MAKYLRCGMSENLYHTKDNNGIELILQKFEADVIDFVRELPTASKIRLVGISDTEIENYLSSRCKNLQDYVVEILSKKWRDRQTDSKLILSQFEFEELGFRTFSELKRQAKRNKLAINELYSIVNHFTKDDSDWYCP